MTSPDHGEPVVGAADPVVSPPLPVAVQPARPSTDRDDEHPIIGWAKAIVGGLSDTAREVLDEGRRGAAEAYDEGWRRFDGKTRFRRRQP
ncbi:MAG: hypothetical protein AB7T37_10555 [Dehalococcoidia bacterium]